MNRSKASRERNLKRYPNGIDDLPFQEQIPQHEAENR